MSKELKRLPAAFFRLSNGREPVREWLKELALEDRRIIGHDIRDLEFSWPIGLPVCRSLGDGLWETMHPEIQRPGPGSCPDCGMALEPMGVPEIETRTEYTWCGASLETSGPQGGSPPLLERISQTRSRSISCGPP